MRYLLKDYWVNVRGALFHNTVSIRSSVGNKALLLLAKSQGGGFRSTKDCDWDIYFNYTMSRCAKGVCGVNCD
ncbi:hypothetical protein ANCCAN_00682 [Ancylostoma caninum]|uniref:Uncharacterized protein n=1 Tax=Ancylostoma caninum TaxID=29170 RepID=A0A368HBW8_ANCCA|nr:hypothetical protein ANCCAN_00682 [Ancylostoma caninum]